MFLSSYFKELVKAKARQLGIKICRITWRDLHPFEIIKDLSDNDIATILDVGANVGQTALELVDRFPNARIHSIEPFPEAYELLRKNTELFPRIITHQLAFGASEGEQPLYINSKNETNSLLKTSVHLDNYIPSEWCVPKGAVEVPVCTIGSFCKKQGIAKIDILKIDTQGYELKILEGALSMLSPERIRFLFMEVLFVPLYEGQPYFDEIVLLLRKHGYKLHGLYEITASVQDGFRWADALFIGKVSDKS